MKLTCKGCGARMECQPRADDPTVADMFHPHPLCAHVLALLDAGVAAGPVKLARLDDATGEIIEDPSGPS